MGNKKIILFVSLYLAVLVFLGSMSYFYGLNHMRVSKQQGAEQNSQDVAYYDLPRMTMTTASVGGKPGQMKVAISLEVSLKDKERIGSYQPRITEKASAYLRQFTKQDVQSNSQIEWVREGLLQEINMVTGPVHIIGIVFRELVLS